MKCYGKIKDSKNIIKLSWDSKIFLEDSCTITEKYEIWIKTGNILENLDTGKFGNRDYKNPIFDPSLEYDSIEN